jgi:hypothetical protein
MCGESYQNEDGVAYKRQEYALIGSIKVSADWPPCDPWQKVSMRWIEVD